MSGDVKHEKIQPTFQSISMLKLKDDSLLEGFPPKYLSKRPMEKLRN